MGVSDCSFLETQHVVKVDPILIYVTPYLPFKKVSLLYSYILQDPLSVDQIRCKLSDCCIVRRTVGREVKSIPRIY